MTLAGKLGLWVTDTHKAIGNLHAIQSLGIDYLIVRVVSHPHSTAVAESYETAALAQLVQDAGTIDLPICAWAYVYPSNITAQAEAIAAALPDGCTALVLDAEVEWENTGDNGATLAGDLLHAIAEATGHKVDLYLSSFCNPASHPLPYEAFLAHCQGFMPQSYRIAPTDPAVVLLRTLDQCPPLAEGSLGGTLVPTVNTPDMLRRISASGAASRFVGANIWVWDGSGSDVGVQGNEADWTDAIAAFHAAFAGKGV